MQSRESVATNFKQLGWNASREWFDQCFEWCHQENPTASRQKLLSEIKNQWCQTDIRESGVQERGQIEECWLKARKIVIRQSISLQMLSAIDISKPAYTQLQEILKVDNANTGISADGDDNSATQAPTQFKAAWEPKGTRVLKLCLTDGFKQIYAIEHEPISAIRYPINPGMKIKLVAPLICRNGTVLLKPKNVHIINEQGIEELMEEFDLKKILTTKIGTDYVGPVQTDNQIPTRNSNNTRPVQTDNQIPTRNSNNTRQNNITSPVQQLDGSTSQGHQMNRQTSREPSRPQSTQRQPTRGNFAPQTSNFEDEDDDFFNSVDIPEDVPLQRVAPKRSLAGNSKIETTSPTSNITNRSTKPFEYLKNIPDSDEELHIIKGCIVTLATKLNVSPKKEWILSVIITDGSASRQVNISHDFLKKSIGISAKDYAGLNSKSKEGVKISVKNLSEKLNAFNGLIKLQNDNILDLVPINRGHLQQLKNRLK